MGHFEERDGARCPLTACLRRLSAGDVSARSALIEFAEGRLRQLASWQLRASPAVARWEQSGDVHQEAVIRLHRALGEVRPETPRQFFALATLQIRRTLIDLARHHYGPLGHGAFHDSGDVRFPETPVRREGRDLSPEAPMHTEELLRSITSLPSDLREVFDLHHFGGLPHADIALLVGVSERTIKRRWAEARGWLAEQLDDASVEVIDAHASGGDQQR